MKDPVWRERVIRESEEHRIKEVYKANGGSLHALIVQSVNDKPELEKYVGRSLGDIAREEAKQPVEVMIDLSIAGDTQDRISRTGALQQSRPYGGADHRIAVHDLRESQMAART